ncbi:MAG TPA: hypothetical protein ENG51_04425 [Deltaproteobacteria bacterium]|nr:hypothetical protein [Deltaproteobacteria bacterium]
MKVVRTILVTLFLMALFSCSFKPIWDLEGKWKQVDGNQTIEFLQKGKIKLYSNSTVCEANYSFVDKNHFTILFGDLGSIKVAFKVSGKELTITNQEGKKLQFRKVIEKEGVKKEEGEQKVEKEHEAKHKMAPVHEERKEMEVKHHPEHHG